MITAKLLWNKRRSNLSMIIFLQQHALKYFISYMSHTLNTSSAVSTLSLFPLPMVLHWHSRISLKYAHSGNAHTSYYSQQNRSLEIFSCFCLWFCLDCSLLLKNLSAAVFENPPTVFSSGFTSWNVTRNTCAYFSKCQATAEALSRVWGRI